MEQPGLSRSVGGGAQAPAAHQQLPGIHRPGLSRAVRGLVYAVAARGGGDGQADRARHHRAGLRRGLDHASAACRAHRQTGGGGRFRPRRARLRGSAQQGRPLGDGFRARRPDRRAAGVRHPQHEARQGRRAAPHRPDDRGGCPVRDEHRGGEGPAGQPAPGGVRRHRALRRGNQAARSARGRPRPQGHPFRRRLPARRHPQPAGRGCGDGRRGFRPGTSPWW